MKTSHLKISAVVVLVLVVVVVGVIALWPSVQKEPIAKSREAEQTIKQQKQDLQAYPELVKQYSVEGVHIDAPLQKPSKLGKKQSSYQDGPVAAKYFDIKRKNFDKRSAGFAYPSGFENAGLLTTPPANITAGKPAAHLRPSAAEGAGLELSEEQMQEQALRHILDQYPKDSPQAACYNFQSKTQAGATCPP